MTDEATEAYRQHANHHPGRIPTPERVNEAHTQMSREDFNRPGGHRVYTQSGEEACYLCALLHEIKQLRAALKPFAEIGKKIESDPDRYGDANELDDWGESTFGDCRRALAVLSD